MMDKGLNPRVGHVAQEVARSIRATLKGVLLGSAILLGASSCAPTERSTLAGAKPPAAPGKMNVLFIVADDMRVGSAYDTGEVLMPNVDKLAAKGIRFQEAQCQFPLCGPSRASFLSGRRPDSTRVYDLTTHVRAVDPNLVTMPQYFRQNGYYAARIGKMYHQGVPGMIGLPVAEDLHDDPASWDYATNPIGVDKEDEWDDKITNLTKNAFGIALAYHADTTGKPLTDELIATKAIEQIAQHKDKPFFIAAGFYRPHVPDVAPKKYFDMYPSIKWHPETRPEDASVKRNDRDAGKDLTADQLREFVRGYYASMSFVDAQVGRLLEALQKNGVADNTIVVFMSDHGYNLGEHNHWEKMVLWRESTRVPLVIYAPKAKGNGKASTKLVELLDVYPTLADLAGLPPPKGVEGHSLRPLFNDPNAASWDYPARTQVGENLSVRFENWRYSEWGKGGVNGAELYDLKADPSESHNIAADPRNAAVVAKLKAMLPPPPPPYAGPKLPGEKRSYRDRVEAIYRAQHL